jgi:hypothetical protein
MLNKQSKTHSLEECMLSGCRNQIITDEDGNIFSMSLEKELLSCKDNTTDLLGKNITTIISLATKQDSMIQPLQMISQNEKEYSKWIHGCYHQVDQFQIWHLEDLSDLISFYQQESRDPKSVESIRKVPIDVPEYIIDSKYETGDSAVYRISKMGIIIQSFPFEISILVDDCYNQPLTSIVNEKDQFLVMQAMSECIHQGFSSFVFRSKESDNGWIQGFGKKQDQGQVLLCLHQIQPPPTQRHASYISQAWDYLAPLVQFNNSTPTKYEDSVSNVKMYGFYLNLV